MGRIRKAGKTDQADMRRHCGWFRGKRLLVCLAPADAQEDIFSLLTAMRSQLKIHDRR